MKLYTVMTLLMFFSSSATALNIDIGSIDLDLQNFAVRILLNRGQPTLDGSFCSSKDQDLIQSSLNQVLPLPHRNLRADGQQGREPVNCRTVCQGFAKGSCYVAYSGCRSYRRELPANEEEVEEESITNEDTPRSMLGLSLIANACSTILKPVEDLFVAIINEIDEGLSSPCLTLVRKTMRVECVY